MNELIVTVKTVTPLFLGGADGKTPELRTPSIKGMMRFWWRALNGHQSIEDLRKAEAELFGSSDEGVGRSKFSLKIIRAELEKDNYKPVLKRNFTAQAFKPEQTFKLVLSATNSFSKFEMVCNLLKISLILGGIGKRSRRGFGSLKIVNINGSDFASDYSLTSICYMLNVIVPNSFKVDDSKIKRINTISSDADYPYIKEIEIGKPSDSYDALIQKIGKASHDYDCYYTGFVESSHRFASPVYVSIIKDNKDKYLPVVTTLNCSYKGGFNSLSNDDKKIDKTNDFIKAVLS